VLAAALPSAAWAGAGELFADVPAEEGWLCVPFDWEALVPEPPLEPPVPVPEEAAVWEPDVAFEAAEVTVDATLLTVDLTPESPADCPDCPDWPGKGESSVAAWACRENRSMITKIPAATSASCIARRAMRRAIGCSKTAPHLVGRPGSDTRVQGKRDSHVPRSPRSIPTCCTATNVQLFSRSGKGFGSKSGLPSRPARTG